MFYAPLILSLSLSLPYHLSHNLGDCVESRQNCLHKFTLVFDPNANTRFRSGHPKVHRNKYRETIFYLYNIHKAATNFDCTLVCLRYIVCRFVWPVRAVGANDLRSIQLTCFFAWRRLHTKYLKWGICYLQIFTKAIWLLCHHVLIHYSR